MHEIFKQCFLTFASIKRETYALFGIVAVAAVVYFWGLGRADIVTDEAWFAVRAIGMVDFSATPAQDMQSTPWQWVEQVPWWMHLSFFDHPPLVFLLQHFSMLAFGETPFAVRLPSVLTGLASVFFVYYIGKRLYSTWVGLAAAILFAFTMSHVLISRIGLFEGVTASLMLVSFAVFLKGLERAKWLYVSAALLGLSFMAKYIAIILAPIFLTILFVRRYEFLYSRALIFCGVIFIVIISPAIIYNIQLYRNFGHFDYYTSYFLKQSVEAWPIWHSREIDGSIVQRILLILPRIIQYNSPYFIFLVFGGAVFTIFEMFLKRALKIHAELLIVIGWLIAFVIAIGPALRFVTLFSPWFAIFGGIALSVSAGFVAPYVLNIIRNIGAMKVFPAVNEKNVAIALLLIIIGAVEIFYTYNTLIAVEPIGQRPWLYRALHPVSRGFGFNQLDQFLSQELSQKIPEVPVSVKYSFVWGHILARGMAKQQKGFVPAGIGIVYNDNMNLPAQEWIFARRVIYDGWPMMTAAQFIREGPGRFHELNVKKIYFINTKPVSLQDRSGPHTQYGDILESELLAHGIAPSREITDPLGRIAFTVYEFNLNLKNDILRQ